MAGDLGDTLGTGRADRRDDPAPAPRWPPDPTAEQRDRWAQPGYDRFQDAEHQRWAQGHRSAESLREAGRKGYAEMRERAGGEERTFDRSRSYRLEHPTAEERAMIERLGALGLREGADYEREYPLRYDHPEGGRAFIMPDMAWPARRLAIEVHGSIRESRYGDEVRARDARKAAVYAREGWRVLTVTGRELREDPAGVREQARAFLAGPDGPGRAEGERDERAG